ncbi:hypothetical protein [Nonomuraea sp. NPDC049400]|uniref:hypothetical protein n=1 Tax=Nonomuraea sp. NPDC049400 TaxID=3364352 RepID=UPI00379B8B8B
MPVPDGGWDWTPQAVSAYGRVYLLAQMYGCSPEHVEHELAKANPSAVTFEQVMKHCPEAIDPAWWVMSDAELDAVAAAWCGGLGFYGSGDSTPFKVMDAYAAPVSGRPNSYVPHVVNAPQWPAAPPLGTPSRHQAPTPSRRRPSVCFRC